jgi:hypothetical protein
MKTLAYTMPALRTDAGQPSTCPDIHARERDRTAMNVRQAQAAADGDDAYALWIVTQLVAADMGGQIAGVAAILGPDAADDMLRQVAADAGLPRPAPRSPRLGGWRDVALWAGGLQLGALLGWAIATGAR